MQKNRFMDILEGNKLIAEFMGGEVQPDLTCKNYRKMLIPYWAFHLQNFDTLKIGGYEYHSSWDWLMPVVEKFEQVARVDIYGKACRISQSQWTMDIAHINENKITATWICVVEFIKWLNDNSHTNKR